MAFFCEATLVRVVCCLLELHKYFYESLNSFFLDRADPITLQPRLHDLDRTDPTQQKYYMNPKVSR